MTNNRNPGRPEELSPISERIASGALGNFYTSEFCERNTDIWRVNVQQVREYEHQGILQDLMLVGNSPEDNIDEQVTRDGHRVVRYGNDSFSMSAPDDLSTYSQTGTGRNASRDWRAVDGRMIHRDGDDAQIYLRGGSNCGETPRMYDINLAQGVVTRESDGWTVTQQTTESGTVSSTQLPEGTLNISVSGEGEDRQTALNLSGTGVSYHATDAGIEIILDNSPYRFLLANGTLFALNPAQAGQARDGLYTGEDGRAYRLTKIPDPEALGIVDQLGLNSSGGITIDGLTVSVDSEGNVIAHTEETDGKRLSILLGPDGSQSVTSGDGYTSRIGPDGIVQIFDATGRLEAYFDPFSGIVGNEDVQFGTDFTCIDGLYVTMMGLVLEAALHTNARRVEQANAEANVALQSADTNVAFVQGHLGAGTVGPYCFSALSVSVNQLSSALGACLAAGANQNISAIVAALGEVYTQMSLAHFKFNAQLAGQRMGVHDKYLLAKMQNASWGMSDANTVATQFAPASAARTVSVHRSAPFSEFTS